MKASALYTLILSTGLVLTGCATKPSPDSAHPQPPHSPPAQTASTEPKDPAAITLLQETPPAHYTVIGEATVSKYNVAGIKRQKAIIQDRLRELAASMGGDAIMHLKNEGGYITGTVISYSPSSRA